MYQRPDMITPGVDAQGQPIDPKKMQEHFEDFYEDLFEELNKYGEIESLNVCDNLADHMVGNVYVQFREEEHAANALKNLTGRYYAGRPIIVDFSPVTDFREATCRQYEEDACNRGGYCNFMHLKRISRELRRQLFGRHRRRRSRSRSRSPYRHRSYEERSHGSRGHSRRHDDRITMTVGAESTEAQVQAVRGVEAEAQVAGGIAVQSGKEVKRDELKLHSGTGRRKRRNVLARLMRVVIMIKKKMTARTMWRVEIITVARTHRSRMDMGIDGFGMVCSRSLLITFRYPVPPEQILLLCLGRLVRLVFAGWLQVEDLSSGGGNRVPRIIYLFSFEDMQDLYFFFLGYLSFIMMWCCFDVMDTH
ncbi:UNVERIFIED_CONTAM: Splicing factor U2af small subunit B [Sesamum calycinum]|uniref:Splicing factor U2af small subunit B n=1 Tax=Sesamum calycinum TaxID=2727403 RepID=A0AAW2SDS8_9LAMI